MTQTSFTAEYISQASRASYRSPRVYILVLVLTLEIHINFDSYCLGVFSIGKNAGLVSTKAQPIVGSNAPTMSGGENN